MKINLIEKQEFITFYIHFTFYGIAKDQIYIFAMIKLRNIFTTLSLTSFLVNNINNIMLGLWHQSDGRLNRLIKLYLINIHEMFDMKLTNQRRKRIF